MLAFAMLAAASGCQESPATVAPARAPAIPVSKPIPREVTDYVDFTGRIDAVHAVDVRSRVTGYLVKMPFREGAEVKAGDLLFEIDPRPYQAQFDSYQAQLNLYQAQLKLARTVYSRDIAINSKVPNSISQQHLDQDYASVEEADARVKSYEKSMEIYKLNLEFTQVTSPIDGQVSRYYLTLGNLVNQDSTLLTTVVSLDPMYAFFDMDEPTLLRIRKAVNEGRIRRHGEGVTLPVLMGLQGEEGFPHEGKINFFNNQLNPTTGSISVRGVFPNPEPKGGVRLLSPGMFVRIRLPIGAPKPSLLVIDRAVASDQGLKYVYVVDSKNRIQYRRVTTGAQQTDGLRAIDEGLEPDDWVVIGGLLQVRPRMQVQPEKVPMPTLTDRPSTGEPPEPSPSPKSKSSSKGKGKAKEKANAKKAATPDE